MSVTFINNIPVTSRRKVLNICGRLKATRMSSHDCIWQMKLVVGDSVTGNDCAFQNICIYFVLLKLTKLLEVKNIKAIKPKFN